MNEKKFPHTHKRVKKKLLAPMNHLLQGKGWEVQYIEISHERTIVPEVFWITYLNDKIGLYETSLVMLKLIETSNKIHANNSQPISGLASSFNFLSTQEKDLVLNSLKKENILETFNHTLSGIKYLFPDFPLNFLITNPTLYEIGELDYLKSTLNILNDRLSKETTFTLAHLIYPLVSIDIIKVNSELSVLKTTELLKYPDTEESKLIAAELRMISKVVDGKLLKDDIFGWRKAFWRRCFILEPCRIDSNE